MVLLFSGILAIEWLAPTKKKDGADNYEKTAYLEQYGGDLGSTLMIFPDSLEGKTDIKFKSGLNRCIPIPPTSRSTDLTAPMNTPSSTRREAGSCTKKNDQDLLVFQL